MRGFLLVECNEFLHLPLLYEHLFDHLFVGEGDGGGGEVVEGAHQTWKGVQGTAAAVDAQAEIKIWHVLEFLFLTVEPNQLKQLWQATACDT